jgi:hypothetical protein
MSNREHIEGSNQLQKAQWSQFVETSGRHLIVAAAGAL